MLSPAIELYENDAEDTFFVYGNIKLDWKYTDDLGGESAWKSYDKVKPNLSGNRKLSVRPSAIGTNLPSNIHVFTFTDNKYEADETYIKVKNLSIVDSTLSGKNTPAKNAIDGNFGLWRTQQYTHDFSKWLSATGTDENKFITVELKEPVYLSRLDYIPSDEQNHSGIGSKPSLGRIMQGEVLGSMDGENWTKLDDINNWANNASTKMLKFAESQKVKYVKIVATQTNGGYIGARGFNFYEDTTKEASPTATITYSTTQKTNKDVIATLEDFNSDTVVVENGITSYTFTENGEYIFKYSDKAGNQGAKLAKVTWIDKTIPTPTPDEFEITSDKYEIKDNMILNISQLTTVDDFKSLITVNRRVYIVNKDGIEQAGENIVGTGMKLKVEDEDIEYTIVVIGDVNGDGKRTVTDLAKAKLHIIEKEILEGEYLQALDVDKNGEIGITDIAVLKMSLIDLIDID